jgi:Zn-dependent metalloprotease
MKARHLTTILFTAAILVAMDGLGQAKVSAFARNFTSPFAQKSVTSQVQPVHVPTKGHVIPTNNGSFFVSMEKYGLVREGIENELVTYLGLSKQHSFHLLGERTDKLGMTNLNLQQVFKGIPLDGCNVLVHVKDGKVVSMNGKIGEFTELATQPGISKKRSFTIAKEFLKVGADVRSLYPIELVIVRNEKGGVADFKLAYKVRVDALQQAIMCYVYVEASTGAVLNKIDLIHDADTPGSAHTLYSGTQSITCDSYAGHYRLRESSRNIQTFDATNADSIDQNGFTGAQDFTSNTTTWTGVPYLSTFVISAISQSWWYTIFADEAPDLFIVVKDGASQVVYTSNYVDNTFPTVTFYPNVLLQNPPYTVEVWDYDAVGGNDFGGSYPISTNAGTQSWSGGGNSGTYSNNTLNNPALDVHWGMEKTYDFYSDVFGRDSYDGNGSIIRQFLNPPTLQTQHGFDPNNASALPPPYNCMQYGMGDGQFMGPVVGLDVEGHEFSHMVVGNNGNGGLTYQGESGALNESFADIMGTSVEFYTMGAQANWTIGEDVMIAAPYLRNMANPSDGALLFSLNGSQMDKRQPDTYEGALWVNPNQLDNDHGGVHANSGVQNFWFYLLSQGGSGTNDIGNAYSVSGIGISQAQQIAYRNLTTYLTPNATYQDAYLGSLQAAEDLYGNPSTQYDAVRDAWYAVGIGNSSTAYCSGETDLTAPNGTFSDGSGNANYLNNADCRWVIAPPGAEQVTLNFTAFNTENGYDSVMVYDGYDENAELLMVWWGNTLPPTIQSTGGALCVRFMSDELVNAPGWTATYTSTGTPTCDGGTVFSSPSGTFSDGSGSGTYGHNQFCYWFIAPPCASTVTLSFSAFDTEQDYDGVIVYDDLEGTNQIALLTGTSIPSPVTSTTGVMTVVFISDYLYNYQGFTANYTSTGSGYCSGTTILNSSDGGTFSDGSGTNNYCNNQDCSWLIQPPQATSVTLQFSAFDVEPISQDGFTVYDAVEVYDGTNASAPLLGRFTGNTLPPAVTSTGGSIYVRFYSDLLVTRPGWTATYTSNTTTYCGGTTSLTAPSGTFSDGSGSNQYGNNSECSWHIHPPGAQSITLSFNAFDTEANNDGVVVYDGADNTASVLGQFSGTSIPPMVTSTGGEMYVEFLSNQTARGGGWTAEYNSITTGVGEMPSSDSFRIYPNPNKGVFTIELPVSEYQGVEIKITDMLGKTVWSSSPDVKSANKVNVDLSSEAEGVYLVYLIGDGKSEVRKISVQR